MHLGRPQHRDGQPAVQQDTLGGDLAGAVALAGPVVVVGGGRHGGLRLGDGAGEMGGDLGVDVVTGVVDVDGLAGDDDGAGGVAGERQDAGGVGRGVAGAVDEEVGAGAEGGAELAVVGVVGGDEAGAGGGEGGGHPGGIPAGDVHLPAGCEQAASGCAADHAGAADDQGAGHPASLLGRAGQVCLRWVAVMTPRRMGTEPWRQCW